MENIEKAMQLLDRSLNETGLQTPIPFEEFIGKLASNPSVVMRNVFQIFRDMVLSYVEKGEDEYRDDPESIDFVDYDCTRLFVEDSDHPFFADRLFSNRLVKQVEDFTRGAQQNKIYIFEGPPGCGKSTFLNNLLMKFEAYANTDEGLRHEAVWRLDREALGDIHVHEAATPLMSKLCQVLNVPEEERNNYVKAQETVRATDTYIEIPCPSHDNPILLIPKNHRRSFFDELFANDEFKWKLFTEKEYEWVFKDNPCTICSSLYQALLHTLKSPLEVFKMLYAQPFRFNRRLGEGISVFNPGDKPVRQVILTNAMLQNRINTLLKDSNQVKYIFSRYAKTNNGVYALMDIKSHNIERLIELHNIVSEGLHKVEDIEENVNSLLIALMNPEDKKSIKDLQSFSDRIAYINIPYVLDINTEVKIYRDIFGRHIDEGFLPRVLHNFARTIIATRLNTDSKALLEWIGDPSKYKRYCDKNLLLLKMELYTGYIPPWLSEEDYKGFTAKVRRKILAEAEAEGEKGFSGRDAIKIFNAFYSPFAHENKLINMAHLCDFFTKHAKDLSAALPEGFLDSLQGMYNYTILQEVKESLYYYNEKRISRDIQNYLFAINFEKGSVETCNYTGEKLEITDDFFEGIENHLIGAKASQDKRREFRGETQKEYTSRTLTQEIMLEGKPITDTNLYQNLHEQYVRNLKEKVLDPFLDNQNFRRAIKDFDTESFKTYDQRIRNDVTFLIDNLCRKFHYTKQGAQEVCMYVIDSDLAKEFAN